MYKYLFIFVILWWWQGFALVFVKCLEFQLQCLNQ